MKDTKEEMNNIEKKLREKLCEISEKKIKEKDCNSYEEKDIKNLVRKLVVLNDHGLSEMTDRLLKASKINNFYEMLTEINFTEGLLKSNLISKKDVSYEGEEYQNIDLGIVLNSRKYLIQIKSLSTGEDQNRRNKNLKKIEEEVKKKKISQKKLVSISSKNFGRCDVEKLADFIKENAGGGESCVFWKSDSDHQVPIEVKFDDLNSDEKLEFLTVVGCENNPIANPSQQIKKALENANKPFNRVTDLESILLIAMDFTPGGNIVDLISFAEAVFGTEEGFLCNSRRDNGFFTLECKVFGVIGLIKRDLINQLSNDYAYAVFINPKFDMSGSLAVNENEAKKVNCKEDLRRLLPGLKYIDRHTKIQNRDNFGFTESHA